MSPVIEGRIIGHNEEAVFVETSEGEGLVLYRQSVSKEQPSENNTYPRLAPGRDQYRGHTPSFLQNAHPELAYANPGSFNDLMQAMSQLLEAVAAVLDEQENGCEPLRVMDRIEKMGKAYNRTVKSIESIRAEGVT